MTRFVDAKYIKKEYVNIFAGNIKTGLRKAYGIPRYNDRETRNDVHEYGYNNATFTNRTRNDTNRPVEDEQANNSHNMRLKQLAGYNDQYEGTKNNKALICQALDALKLLIR